MPHSPRGHFMRATELRTLVQSPSTIKYRKESPAPVKCDFSNERLEYCVDIALLAERCDRSGFLRACLSGMRWEMIPPEKQGQVAADIRRFRRELREGGYSVG
jgi:hypothetical protein